MTSKQNSFDTPILLVIFNRPEKVKKIIDALRSIQPTHLYVAADGPRTTNTADATLCDQARAEIANIDWPCSVVTKYAVQNIGVDPGVELAVTWFFSQVDEGIILEDDCLPHPDFFSFTATLLEKYRHTERVMHIAGSNFQKGIKRGPASYYFSKYPSTWGWATWRRAWTLYDTNMASYDSFLKENMVRHQANSASEARYWKKFFTALHGGKYQYWDAKWVYTLWSNNGIAIIPNVPLVQNVGFGQDATHTKHKTDAHFHESLAPLGKITHPQEIAVCTEADKFLFEKIYKFTIGKKIAHAFNAIQSYFKKNI